MLDQLIAEILFQLSDTTRQGGLINGQTLGSAAELDRLLQQAFDTASKLYKERGFQRCVGFGKRPALVSVDLANARSRPGNPFTCDQGRMDNEIIPGMQKLLKHFRANKLPVVHVTTAYEIPDRNADFTDMGQWHHKIPIEVVDLKNTELWAIDSRIAPIPGEYTLLKKRASSFHGTELAGILRANDVDTIVVTSVAACACMRQTIRDGIADGFRTIAAREAIGDRAPGAVAWNLFDIDATFGDVESVDDICKTLDEIDRRNRA